MVIRARIVLAAAEGQPNAAIAAETGMHIDTVRKWRRRFFHQRLGGLSDRPRPGRPPTFTPVQVAEIKQVACTLPGETGVPLSRWSRWSLADRAGEAVERGVAESISASTVRRWLAADAIKPWQHRSWIFPRNPDFAARAARVLDLYARTWDGEPLGEDNYVISADEKSQLQALRRRHRCLPPAPGRRRRVEFEYVRGGILAYFAAYDVYRAHAIGRIAPKTGIEPFSQLVDQVMTTEPYAYKWFERPPTQRQQRRTRFDAAVTAALKKARGLHGSPRLHADLRDEGWTVSEKTVADSMRRQGLVARRIKPQERADQAGQARTEVP